MKNYSIEILDRAGKIILGKNDEIMIALACFFAGGHLLVEDAPGMGKTTFAKLISKLLGLDFMRVQFTNDLMPSDLLGANIYDFQKQEFKFFEGPIFTNLLLADELNRASPKTQSALLQSMEEREVSIDRKTFKLSDLFFVVATQNPFTQVGTNLLPESQLDRFMICTSLGYPSKSNELLLLKGFSPNAELEKISALWSREDIVEIKKKILEVHVSETIIEKAYEILSLSRNSKSFLPLSPRCGVDLIKCARAYSFLNGRDYVTSDDIKLIAPKIINHRLRSNIEEVNASHEILQQVHFDN